MPTPKKKGSTILEGRFVNLQRNFVKLMRGEISGSGSLADKAKNKLHFYNERELVTKKTHITGSKNWEVTKGVSDGKKKADIMGYLNTRKIRK